MAVTKEGAKGIGGEGKGRMGTRGERRALRVNSTVF